MGLARPVALVLGCYEATYCLREDSLASARTLLYGDSPLCLHTGGHVLGAQDEG